MKNNLVVILSKLVIVLAIFFVGIYVGGLGSSEIVHDTSEVRTEETVSLMIDYGDGSLDVFNDISVTEETSLFDILEEVTQANDIALVYQDYGGDLGVFVQAIDGIGQGSEDMWWQYWVNNRYGQVGVSSYLLEPGDVIEMKFIKGQL